MLQQSSPTPPALPNVFHALADPSRLDIVERLAAGSASVSDIAGAYPMSLSAVLQHLKVLEQGGVIRTSKAGRVRTCHLEPEALRIMESWIVRRRAALERRLDRLEAYLDKEDTP